jgi:hypothetical protein
VVTADLASDPIPGWARRLLILAAVWLVLLGTVVPVFAPGLGAWLPAHEHHTLTAFVPPHTHTYDRATSAPAGAACEATTHAHTQTSGQDVPVVCTMSDDIASGSLAVVVPDAPVTLPGIPAASASNTRITTTTPVDPHASVLTPPPRG